MAKLVYIVGASGCGKDALMAYARQNLPSDARVAFAHRDAAIDYAITYELADMALTRHIARSFAIYWTGMTS